MKTRLIVGLALLGASFATWAAAGCPMGCC